MFSEARLIAFLSRTAKTISTLRRHKLTGLGIRRFPDFLILFRDTDENSLDEGSSLRKVHTHDWVT
jgi:hypothetical protein